MNLNRFQRRTKYNNEKENKKNNYTYLNNNYCKTGQIVLAGDSITELFNMELFDVFSSETGLIVYNRGISGDTSDRLLERFNDNVLSLEPKAIVLLIGTNDLTLNADADYVAENISNLLDMISEKCPDSKCILEAVYPVDYKNVRKNKKIKELNIILSQIANDRGVAYLDITEKLTDNKGGFNTEYTYDGLHPNVKGFEIVAADIIDKLKSILA